MKDKKKDYTNRGITLIALVITIIVLLILVAVSIATLTGENGILTKAGDTKTQTAQASAEEQVNLALLGSYDSNGNLDYEALRDNLNQIPGISGVPATITTDDFPLTVTVDGYQVTITGTEVVTPPSSDMLLPGETASSTKKDNYTDGTDTATIPEGFTVSETEYTISTGLVVIAPDESEFVWVPVADINTMATAISGTDSKARTNYQGKLYNFTGTGDDTTSSEMTGYGQGTTTYREPSLVTGDSADTYASVSSITGTSYDASSSYYSTILGYSSAIDFGKDMQEDYNAMVESVDTYGGFYIGRYETSINKNTVASVSGVLPMSAEDTSGNTWYGMYKLQKEYASNIVTSVTSTMIWGSQYDAMLNWALTGNDKEKVIATGNGNHNGTVNTGETTKDKINNIYDLEGNQYEWTLEADYTNFRVRRGGDYDITYSPSVRDSSTPSNTGAYSGSRLALYM